MHFSSGADRGARASASVASVVPTGHGCVSGEAGLILHTRATASTHGVLGPRQGHSHPQLSNPVPSSHIHLGTFTRRPVLDCGNRGDSEWSTEVIDTTLRII